MNDEPHKAERPLDRDQPAAGWRRTLLGLVLFLFIPLVLFLLVAHPPPVAASLAAGVGLIVVHRFLARPYMRWVLPHKCLWCNGTLAPDQASELLRLRSGSSVVEARCCPHHVGSARRFFAFVEAWRWPLRLGIFLPLLALLGALAMTAAGQVVALDQVTAGFRLVVGLSVNLAAWGYLAMAPSREVAVPFPVHNFFLLGVRNLLWIFRWLGLWWIFLGARFFLGG